MIISSASAGPEQSKVVGFTAALTACMLSGFAGDHHGNLNHHVDDHDIDFLVMVSSQ